VELLSTETVAAWLAQRGLVPDGAGVEAAELEWGVSNVVLAVRADSLHAVVKQALPRLRVQEEWLAKRERTLTEAEALRLAARIAPGSVPAVLDVDAEACAMAIAHAPDGWRNWKELLLAGEADPAIGRRLGELLRAWQEGTLRNEAVASRFGDFEAFDQLRVDPYHRAVMRRWPSLARAIGEYAEELLATHVCLVHGDFSPKNVLVGPEGVWVLDFEVAHFGDPVFDPAFMLNHLMLKAIHRPGELGAYQACAETFLAAYEDGLPWELRPDPPALMGHVGCLMLARVDGKSPAEYLTESERLLARVHGTRLVTDPPATLDDAWTRLAEALRG
jgi:5-methylthioribose kinase